MACMGTPSQLTPSFLLPIELRFAWYPSSTVVQRPQVEGAFTGHFGVHQPSCGPAKDPFLALIRYPFPSDFADREITFVTIPFC